MKRILPLLLVSLILTTMLISCNEINTNTNTNTESDVQIIDTDDATTNQNADIISGADAIQISLAHFYGLYGAKPSLGDYYSACIESEMETDTSHFVTIYEKCYPDDSGYEEMIDGGCITYEISKTNGDILRIIPGE